MAYFSAVKLLSSIQLVLCAVGCAAGISITDPGQGVYDYSATADGLSGITWHDGDNWYAVSDANGKKQVYRLSISLNSSNGKISSALIKESCTLAAGYDLEGIAYAPSRGTFFISDEGLHPDGGYIREHSLPDGTLVHNVTIPAVMQKDRANLGLESCTWGANALWTANQEALNHESSRSTHDNGTRVRLQKFDSDLQPAGEWVYETDPYASSLWPLHSDFCAVSALLALPDGNLLVLEQSVTLRYRSRIYLVDFTGATDVSDISDLDGASYTQVSKTCLWSKEMKFGNTKQNFEGMALGPALPHISNGSYSLVLVADNGGNTDTQHLYSLVINGVTLPIADPEQEFGSRIRSNPPGLSP
jgi:hypothetical protein